MKREFSGNFKGWLNELEIME